MIFSRDILVGLLIALLIASAVGGFNYWRKYQERKLDEIAEVVYLYEKGDLPREEALAKVKNTPYMLYFLVLTQDDPEEIARLLQDTELKKLFLEKSAYRIYKSGDPSTALQRLNTVSKEDFSYPSAMLLKAIVHESTGDLESARGIYSELSNSYGDTYFGRVAYARLLSLKRE